MAIEPCIEPCGDSPEFGAGAAPAADAKGGVGFIYLLVMLSGVAGLGYQMVWSRMFAVSLGHEIPAVLAVVGAFFFGLALGGALLNRRLRQTRYPQRWYAALEIVIGLWALVLAWLLPMFNLWIPQWIGVAPSPLHHWAVAFAATALLLLPATMAMGATLPAIEGVVTGLRQRSNQVAGLYAVNTLGAVVGTLGATFWLVPQWGLHHTLLLFAAINLCCGLSLLGMVSPQRVARTDGGRCSAVSPPISRRRLRLTLFVTGLLGIGFEVLVVRVLSQVLENTVFTYAAILAVYLLGTTLGAALYQRYWTRQDLTNDQWRDRLARLITLTAFLALCGVLCLWLADDLYRWVLALIGLNFFGSLAGEMAVAALVFLLPTLSMGALFSHLAQSATTSTGLGQALGLNTLGSSLAPLIFGVSLLPLLGAKLALVLLTVGYLALLPWPLSLPMSQPMWFSGWRWLPLLPAVLAAAVLAMPLPLRFVTVPAGGELVDYREGVMASVAVVADAGGYHHLKVNNRFTMGGTATRFSDHRQTHLPMLLYGGAPKSALYLGLGTGITFEAAQYYPGLHATGVELIPEMLPLLGYFDVHPQDWPQPPDLYSADARRFVLSSDKRYDVIVADVFHPSRDGAGALYTVEHFQAVKARLNPDGLFCQWLPLFQLDLNTLRSIVQSFLVAFPDAQMHVGHFSLQQPILCLLGGRQPRLYSENWLLNRVHDRQLQQQLVGLRLNSDFALFGGFLADARALRRFAGDAPLNTDDNAVITFSAPDFVYAEHGSPGRRLISLLQQLGEERGTLLADDDSAFAHRLHNYWRARDIFLAAGVDVDPGVDIRQLVAQVRQPLLRAVAASGDFSPAYQPLLAMAQSLFQVDRRAALQLLADLDSASPDRDGARRLRRELFGQ